MLRANHQLMDVPVAFKSMRASFYSTFLALVQFAIDWWGKEEEIERSPVCLFSIYDNLLY